MAVRLTSQWKQMKSLLEVPLGAAGYIEGEQGKQNSLWSCEKPHKASFQNKTHPNPTTEQHWNSCLATAVFAGLGQRCGNTISSNCTKNFQMMQKQRQRCCSWGQDRPVTLGFEQEPQVL